LTALSIETLLFKEPQGVQALIGAGGKTSLMFQLARLLRSSGKRVLTTTTTKIFVPTREQSAALIVASAPSAVLHQASTSLANSRHITAAAQRLPDSNKLKGFSSEDILQFAESGVFDWILVEADGAAHRPLKAAAAHEPVIPSCTSILMAVIGLDVLNQPLSEKVVFRCELAGPRMGLKQGEPVSEAALVRLILHPAGVFKDAPPGARRFIFLNKGDNAELCAAGSRIAALLSREDASVAEAVVVGQALDELRIHALHYLASMH
jgi:probable selenium-dependent hydroxylase accessory protein YqeC